jgi:hypothetical protein
MEDEVPYLLVAEVYLAVLVSRRLDRATADS